MNDALDFSGSVVVGDSPRWVRVKNLKWSLLVFLCSFAVASCTKPKQGSREDPEKDRLESEFVREATLLSSMTEIGVNYERFGDQLAKTSAAFETLKQADGPRFHRPSFTVRDGNEWLGIGQSRVVTKDALRKTRTEAQ